MSFGLRMIFCRPHFIFHQHLCRVIIIAYYYYLSSPYHIDITIKLTNLFVIDAAAEIVLDVFGAALVVVTVWDQS